MHHYYNILASNSRFLARTRYYHLPLISLSPHRNMHMGCLKLSIRRNRKVLKVDGKVIEFTSAVAVKEFEGFGVKSSRESSKLLPPPKNQTVDGGVSTTTAVKRIKIVITKKQLEELLSKKTSVEKIIFGIVHPNWKPSLVAIPEENELI